MVANDATTQRSRIFISYRREDAEYPVGRLAEDLRKHFARDQVFQDIASIDPGADFVEALNSALDTCAAVLVVIGPKWLAITDRQGRRRLDLPGDWVRHEIAESLRQPAVRVFPLLLDAEMPSAEELPEPLRPLTRRQAFPLTGRHWSKDVAELVECLRRVPGLGTPLASVAEAAKAKPTLENVERATRPLKADDTPSPTAASPQRLEKDEPTRVGTTPPLAAGEKQLEGTKPPPEGLTEPRVKPNAKVPWKLVGAIAGTVAIALALFTLNGPSEHRPASESVPLSRPETTAKVTGNAHEANAASKPVPTPSAAGPPVKGEVTFAYQDMMNPWRWVQQTQEVEKATGYKINWRQFAGDGDVIRAMASGEAQLGEVRSTGVAGAISRGVDVELFWILEDLAASEALVARNGTGINTIADLTGKKVATPFGSTSHFQLIYALRNAGLKPRDVQLLNMRPPEIATAWGRGDIDATFIWDSVLSAVKKNGKVLLTSGEGCKRGACGFDGLVVVPDFAKENPEFMVALVKALAKADADYRDNPRAWTSDPAKVAAVAKWSGGRPEDVADEMALYGFPSLREQASAAWLGGGANGGAARALAQQANFLKEQGQLSAVVADYSKNVTTKWVSTATNAVGGDAPIVQVHDKAAQAARAEKTSSPRGTASERCRALQDRAQLGEPVSTEDLQRECRK